MILSSIAAKVGTLVVVAGLAGGAWLYVSSLQSKLEIAERNLAAKTAELTFERQARRVAVAESVRQEARAGKATAIKQEIRRSPNAEDTAPALILDTVRRLRRDDDRVPPGAHRPGPS